MKITTRIKVLGLAVILLFGVPDLKGQASEEHTVARRWNEVLLDAIRNDFARPTVHARNLFHTSIALYDIWAVYDPTASPYFLGRSLWSFQCPFEGVPAPDDVQAAREEAMSYAVYRILRTRFQFSPGATESLPTFDALMTELGYDITDTSDDYASGSPAALGNYVANCLIQFGRQDGSNELLDYRNEFYEPINPPMVPAEPGSQGLEDANRWQPLSFDFFIDQSGFQVPGDVPEFLSPEWGQVVPFALQASDRIVYERDGNQYWVYHDPGAPVYLNEDDPESAAEYQWGHSLVAVWSSHLDPDDGVMIDISPANIGNLPELPANAAEFRDFYDLLEGGDTSRGHDLNPVTGEPYPAQMVPRADYARVLAEFWADGPDSETPPGHWFTILNYVNDHPQLEKRFKGEGELLDDLEWDVKSYFLMGGAVHDAAVAAWGIKGWYDYIRPISAIRYMAEQGQSTDQDLPNYNELGIPLVEGLIELVEEGDPLEGASGENVGKIKLYAWRGPEFISDPDTELAGVNWILADDWWPYQRPTFVTPPFAGYVSGHSTFSRAAAEVMTLLTGDEFFPGGVGEFEARQNEFLVFEEGPSVDVVLQWATYRDASDQTSLSRIWGGIHPPVDDIPGRRIGIVIGQDAFALAEKFFDGALVTSVDSESIPERLLVYPNPVKSGWLRINYSMNPSHSSTVELLTLQGQSLYYNEFEANDEIELDLRDVQPGIYLLTFKQGEFARTSRLLVR